MAQDKKVPAVSAKAYTCVKGHTGKFVETWNSDPKYRIWYMGCATCGTGVFWSGGK